MSLATLKSADLLGSVGLSALSSVGMGAGAVTVARVGMGVLLLQLPLLLAGPEARHKHVQVVVQDLQGVQWKTSVMGQTSLLCPLVLACGRRHDKGRRLPKSCVHAVRAQNFYWQQD